jgi:MATE family multidrug resistance protein
MASAAQPNRDPADRRGSWRRGTWIQEVLATLSLSAPIAAGLLAEMGMSVADYVMAGRLGAADLAAAGLGVQMLFVFHLLPMGAIGSVSALGAQAHGAGDAAMVSRVVRQGLRFATCLALPACLIILAVAPLLRLSGHYENQIVDWIGTLLLFGMPSIPAVLWFTVLRNYVTVLGRPVVVTIIILGALPLTLLGNYVTMYGAFGFPAMGVPGIGLTMSIVQWLQLISLVVYINRNSMLRAYHVFSDLLHSDKAIFIDLWRVGWPIAAGYAFESGLFMASTVLMGEFGVATLAAHNAVINLTSISFMIPYSISQAATVRVGYAIGRGAAGDARRSGYIAICLSMIWMLLAAMTLSFMPHTLLSLYMDVNDPANAAAVAMGITLMPIAALFQLVDGLQVATIGSLRGLKDTKVPMILCGCGYWAAGLGSGYLLAFNFGFAGPGLWWGLAIGLVVSATLLFLRWKQMARRYVADMAAVPA